MEKEQSRYQKLLEQREFHRNEFKKLDDKIKKIDSMVERRHRPVGNYGSQLKNRPN